MSRVWVPRYRCRFCGVLFASKEQAPITEDQVPPGWPVARAVYGLTGAVAFHDCNDEKVGIGDLVGALPDPAEGAEPA